MTQFSEAYLNGDGSVGLQCSRDWIYLSFGEPDGEQAEQDLAAYAPLYYRTGTGFLLPRKAIAKKQITETVYEFTVNYSVEQNQVTQSDPDKNEFNTTLAFNLVGGTQHITTSLNYTNFSPSGAGGSSHTANDCVDIKGVIGLDLQSGQVRGVDAFAPVMDFSLTTQFHNSVVTDDYIDDVYALTGQVNIAAFQGRTRRPAGSVIFKGARGTKKGNELWEISFEFAFSPNQTGIVVGSITGITKLGWQYMDVLYKAGTDTIGGQAIQVPAQVNIHTVYPLGDFSKLKIGL